MLDHTPKEIVERQALRINPARTCQPIGAMYAALGIHRCLPHSHGSQGCCAYHRSHLTRHLKEPIMASTSSFTEGSSVFGGQANLVQAFNTIFSVYNPDVIAVHTTCLTETIGDDIPQIINAAKTDGKIPDGKIVIHANTPSYSGSHVTGFANMVLGMVRYLAQNSGRRTNRVNIIPGFVDPSDMREIKKIAATLGVPALVFPDTSDVLDAPLDGDHAMYPKGGVTIPQLKSTGDAMCTLALGDFASTVGARELDKKCGVPCHTLDLPIGLAATDRFVDTLRSIGSAVVPSEINDARGRLVDMISDMHQYFYNKRVAIFGDPDHVIAMTEFVRDLDMIPVHVLTGTQGNRFEARIREIVPDANIKASGDLFLLHQWMKNEPVDLLIGNTYGKFIARAEDTPFVRFGFPILDRVGHSIFPTVGYTGAMRLVEQMLAALMDRIDRDAPDETFELVM
jgi:nitrogenase molybdenum-iron protein beta chain